MKWIALAVLALIAGVAGFISVSLPPHPAPLPPGDATSRVRGAIHIHTQRSDGTGTIDGIAAAAARAGLQFIVITDHGDATREPDAPVYRSGVLVIDAVEISTDGGHVVALGLPKSPYPLAGDARDVVEDVARLGGMSIAAHPGSDKPQLRWVEWAAPFNGIEWLNLDSEWRDERPAQLVRALLTYPFRHVETLGSVLDRPETVLRRWDVLTGRRQVVALAAADAHARLSLRGDGDEYDSVGVLHVPAYEQVFRAFSITVGPVAMTGDAAADARTVVDAVRRGHVYSSIEALAGPAAMTFTAARETVSTGTPSRRSFVRAAAGDVVPVGAGELTLSLASNAPPGARIVLWKNGQAQPAVTGAAQTWTVPGRERGVYRVELQLAAAPGDAPVPWVLSNPIYVGDPAEATIAPRLPASEFASQYENGFATDWTVETSPRSKAALDVAPAVGGTQLSMRWALGGTRSESPYAALVMPAGPALSGYDRLMFTARATTPMRLSVQIRVPTGSQGERWQRSVFLDDTARDIAVFFDEMTPKGATTERRPVLSNVRDVLFVVDTVNTKPGASGQIWIDDVKYGR